jgi:hypothetical protein
LIKPTRVLALDHFFDQDLRALEAHPGLDVRRFPYQRLRRQAMRLMGNEVARGLKAYNQPGLARSRARYAAWLSAEVRRLYLEKAFDALVLPSDTFFYVRSLPAAAHRLGIPVIVVQKETTISQATMDVFSKEVGAEAPFIADLMTVCSERQWEFWLRAGADPARIELTGQPRFDVYASSTPTGRKTRRSILFLTYALDAYVPGAGRGKGLRTWEPLRDETESALLDFVRSGAGDVLVKCHPQQDHRAEARRLAALAGPLWNHGFSLAASDADTRSLIIAADVVVGFQSTALYEAVAAQRCVIYAAWGPGYERFRPGLIPFDKAPSECVRHASTPEALAGMLIDDTAPPAQGCAAWYEPALGVVDGRATERVGESIMDIASEWAPTAEAAALDRQRRQFALGLLARSILAEAVWAAASPLAAVTGEQRRVRVRRQRAHQARSMAAAALRESGRRGVR